MLQKAPRQKHGRYSSILERWHNDYKYINSLSLIGWTEEHIMLHDRIALENHSYVATRAEKIQNSKHWILKLNQDGGNWHCVLLMWKKSKPSQKTKQLDKKNYDALSNPGYVVKRIHTVVPNMELPNGNECTTRPRRCSRQLAKASMVVTKPFWKDGTRMTHTARGVQGPQNQRPDFVEAKRELRRLCDEHVTETSEGNTPIHPVQRT